MPARSIVLAALACFLPILAAQTAKPVAASSPAAAKPDLTGQEGVIEKMALVMRYMKDGSNVRTLTTVEHLLSDAGVRDVGVLSIPYASATETVTYDFVKVHKSSGAVVETPTDGTQEVPLPVTQTAPMYSDLRTKQLPVKSLSVGDTLEYQVTVKDTNADSPGVFWRAQDFTTGVPVEEETIEVRVPRELSLLVKSKKVQPAVTEEGGERVYRWKHETASEYPKKQETDKTAAVNTVQEMYEPDVAITSFHTWAEMGAWYRGLMKGRAVPDAAIQAKADELTHGLTTDDAKVDALYNYVATQYRYIAVSFGIGRLQPHMASEVFRNQYGDCKDKHTLLEAMLAAEKIDAEPVLIGSGVQVNEALPMPSQFDHVITLVKLKDHDVWLDATPEVAPSRMLMANLRDKLALAIPATGDARLVRTETALPFPSFVHETITGKLETGGVLTAHFDLTMRGDAEVIYRAVYHEVPRANWQTLAQRISYGNGFAGDVSAVDASLPEKTAEPFHMSWDYTRKDFGDWPSRRFPGMSTWFDTKIADDATAPKRAILMDATAETEVHVKLTLPEGYTVTVPPDVKHSTAFAEYTATYVLKDRTLEIDRTLRYKVRELPVSEFGAYRDFVKGMSDDSSQMLQLVALETTAKTMAAAMDTPKPSELLRQADEDIRANNQKDARELLGKVKALNDRESGLWAEYGALDSLSNKTQALADYKKELGLHPENSAAYPALVGIYSSQGQWEEAEKAIQAWIKADPADLRPRKELGSLQLMQKKYTAAAKSLQDALFWEGVPGLLQVQLGRAQLKGGDMDAGKRTLHSLMATSDDPAVLNGAAYELADAGLDLEGSEAASRKALRMLEAKAAAVTLEDATDEDFENVVMLAANWGTLGWISFKENKLAGAESYLRSAWMLNMELEAGFHLGTVYAAEGNKDAALTTYRATLQFHRGEILLPYYADMESEMLRRMAALHSAGAKEIKIGNTGLDETDPSAFFSYAIPSLPNVDQGRADFLLLMTNDSAASVRFLSGSNALESAESALRTTIYRTPIPPGSVAKILRHSTLACTMGEKTCILRLQPPQAVPLDPDR